MNKRISLVVLIGSLVTIFTTILFYRSYSIENHRISVQTNIVSKLRIVNKCDQSETNLKFFVSEDFSDICIQPAYMSKEDFERESGKSAESYKIATHDGQVTWWLYYSDNRAIRIDIPGSEILQTSELGPSLCFPKINTTIVFWCESGRPYYKFRTK